MRRCLLLAAVLLVASCSDGPKAPKLTQKAIFEGMTLPGTHADAKAGGFTDCRASYYNYECSIPGDKQLLGIRTRSVKVYLDGSNNLSDELRSSSNGDVRSLSLDQLSYRDIRVGLPKDEFDDRCVQKEGKSYDPPMECLKKPGGRAFMEKLKAAGWIEVPGRRTRNFVQAGIPLQVSVDPYKGEVTIYPEALQNVHQRLSTLSNQQAVEREKQAQANSVVEAMKSPK